MKNLPDNPIFKIQQAADYLGVSVATVRRLIKLGYLPRLSFCRHVLLRKSDIDRFLDAQVGE